MRATLIKFLAFILVCSGFTAYLIVTIGNIHPFQSTYELSAKFDDITGLLPNDNVKVAGVVVGKVTSVGIDKGRAVVNFQVKKGIHVPSDSKAAIRWRNLLGQRYVYIYPGAAHSSLAGGDRISQTVSVVDLGELFNRLGPIVKEIKPDEVNTFLDAVVGALDGNEQKVRQALDDLATLAQTLGQRDAAIGRLVENLNTVAGTIDSRDREIRTILDNLLAITTTFSANTDVLNEAVTQLSRFSQDFGAILENNRGHIDNLLNNLTTVVGVVKQKLPVLDDTVANLDELSSALFRASRYGEWLNQTIYCGAVGRTAAGAALVDTQCDLPVASGGLPGGTTGAKALTQLLGGAQ
ncbi:MAG: phospholipid/cholesterol/gamma-HCH transport system substrate-binding protein [Actinomycetota bacterium]|nr:phospholipid/cholesterol/gamma-HCH transport system substrate-binding protein [Actinomycetota bacterium]